MKTVLWHAGEDIGDFTKTETPDFDGSISRAALAQPTPAPASNADHDDDDNKPHATFAPYSIGHEGTRAPARHDDDDDKVHTLAPYKIGHESGTPPPTPSA